MGYRETKCRYSIAVVLLLAKQIARVRIPLLAPCGCSLVGLERLVVAQKVMGLNPVSRSRAVRRFHSGTNYDVFS